VKIGICGLGTVAGGTINVLKRNAELISGRAGCAIDIVQVGSRKLKDHVDLAGIDFTTNVLDVASNPEVDIVVELMGGYDTALEVVMTALKNGKHVVTANKALIAVHGNEIIELAQSKNLVVAFEAAVAGGIPIIKAIREGLSANAISSVAGIINGTGNFILTEMREKGRDFADVLKEAQALGYAEADPTFDVEGIDAAHKLTILASVAFGVPLQFDAAYTEGISKLSTVDIEHAGELGYTVKHLGICRLHPEGIELRVHPTLIPSDKLLASVNGVKNAVLVESDAVGQTLYYGAGAGAEATASAVIADLVDVARVINSSAHAAVPELGFKPKHVKALPVLPMEQVSSAYYLRVLAKDRPGVLAKVASILSDKGINIESIMQRESEEHDGVIPMMLVTHVVCESAINSAIAEIESLADISGSVVRIRIEHF
jgi:homoserine dehydrogenase